MKKKVVLVSCPSHILRECVWAKSLWAMLNEPLLIPNFHASGPSVVDFFFSIRVGWTNLKNELHFSKIRFVPRTFLESHGLHIYG